ncbi:MAG: 16S rRNA (cytidine(1402)-2'-O)-methyltransferase [Candidatus Nomurabacteria bacterium]|nr:MAG: 16S rRNA (cytidine(1402)-2'-O)-methyltransferase [Candidatus Nomurabacteria bacterium]
MSTGTLFIAATPIGNLEDLSQRALRVLNEVDFVICEDTRVTQKLLQRYDVKKRLVSFHQHSRLARLDKMIEELQSGTSAALVTDAGTPGVSDPGNQVVAAAVAAGIPIVPIPGPSAVTALLSVAGFSVDRYTFLGFLPHKKGRETLLNEIASSVYPVLLFESPHRIVKTLEALAERLPEAKCVVGRELTKQFEEIIRGSLAEVSTVIAKRPSQKGEFVLLVAPS